MTEANQKRLYEHFVAQGMKAEAEAVLKAYPHFKESSKKEAKK